jgi:outer membrane protein OmpA-like peptidoglycan-associated protein
VPYIGTAQTPCTANVTGAGNLAATAVVHYSANINAGTAQATATYNGDANHAASSESSATFTIAKATSATVVTCISPVIATGSAVTPCTAVVTGVGGLSQAVNVDYTSNVAAGQAHASATFIGDGNHDGSTGAATFTIISKNSVIRPTTSWSTTSATQSYRTILTSSGTPAATLSTTSTQSCLINKNTVYFLGNGTCTIKVFQGGSLWRTLATTVSTKNPIVAPAKRQRLTPVTFAPTSSSLSAAARAQLDALVPTLRKASVVIVYGCSSGRADAVKVRANQRAAAVTSYLRSKHLVVLSSAGYGSTIAPVGKTPKDRVDIAIG